MSLLFILVPLSLTRMLLLLPPGGLAIGADRTCVNITTGEDKRCYPEFIDFMPLVRDVHASSTCGQGGPETFCIVDEGNRTHCDLCHHAHPHTSRNASNMADVDLYINKTFWVSERRPKGDVVITLSFNKTFEIFYFIIHFKSAIPRSFSIEKSVDMGRIWAPYQYYSDDCQGVYGIPPDKVITRQNEQEAICTTLSKNERKAYFSTIDKRPSGTQYQSSPVLLDFMAATNLRLTLKHMQNMSEYGVHDSSADFFAIEDMEVGGICKCNGHAGRCVFNSEGEYVCDCQHNTAGPDCERCKPFYKDRPWKRASEDDAQECHMCECNLHAKSCRFNMKTYISTGYVSGGVCRKCKHNTAGTHCERCRDEFYINPEAAGSVASPYRCKACDCDMLGSVSRACDQQTGQCRCKEHVVGRRCNQCEKGYDAANSPFTPCIPAKTSHIDYINLCEPRVCMSDDKRVDKDRYCTHDFVFAGRVVQMLTVGTWYQFTLEVPDHTLFRHPPDFEYKRDQPFVVFIEQIMINCDCGNMQEGNEYVLMIKDQKSYYTENAFQVKPYDAVLPWTRKRSKKFFLHKERDDRGKCRALQYS
uniref:Netrin A n=1 Tax=Isodiametra pulchra TaxID=504439 RepID=A0A2P1DV65_ISOPU|nr:netrin A [Isodiametra pulchra]